MTLKLIDFGARYTEHFMAWSLEHPEQAGDEERIDDLYYELYEQWLDEPKDWLDDLSPNEYFATIDDPRMYVSALIEYTVEGMALPDPLVSQLIHNKQAVYPILLGILHEDDAGVFQDIDEEELNDIRAKAIELISEMYMPHPLERYIDLLSKEEEDSALAEAASEALFGEIDLDLLELLLETYPYCNGYARLAFLDILSQFAGQEVVWDILLQAWNEGDVDIAVLATCFGRFGDERATNLLKEEARYAEDYHTFRALEHAVEALSGEQVEQRSFAGDQLYDFLVNLDDEDE